MSRPLKCNKVSETEDRESMDRISSLPDDLLGYILSFLPTKCAVGTSVLSSRWRCLHMLTNCLSFDASCRSQEMDSNAKESFKKFVYRVLLLHKVSPIKKFSLDCGRHVYDDLDLHNWITAAILKGVERLHLFLNGTHLNALPRCLFSSQNIVQLILVTIENFRVPESIDLPNLKILNLGDITFHDRDSFGKLFSACSSLQELELVSCQWPMDSNHHLCLSSRELKHLVINYCEDQFQVDAPNLAWLQYSTDNDTEVALSLKNTDHLVTAILAFSFTEGSNSTQLARALFKAALHVRELEWLDAALEFLPASVDDHIHSYPNLVSLQLGRCSFESWIFIMHWLANSPRLETLVFYEKLINHFSRKEEWPEDIALVPFSSRVKVIKAYGFRGYKTELVLLKYLLGNAEVLQRVTLYKHRYKWSKEQEVEACNELLMLPRASRTCVVQLMPRRNAMHL